MRALLPHRPRRRRLQPATLPAAAPPSCPFPAPSSKITASPEKANGCLYHPARENRRGRHPASHGCWAIASCCKALLPPDGPTRAVASSANDKKMSVFLSCWTMAARCDRAQGMGNGAVRETDIAHTRQAFVKHENVALVQQTSADPAVIESQQADGRFVDDDRADSRAQATPGTGRTSSRWQTGGGGVKARPSVPGHGRLLFEERAGGTMISASVLRELAARFETQTVLALQVRFRQCFTRRR